MKRGSSDSLEDPLKHPKEAREPPFLGFKVSYFALRSAFCRIQGAFSFYGNFFCTQCCKKDPKYP